MTVLTRWEPFRDLATLQERMNRLFNDQFNAYNGGESLTAGSFVPPVDVYEDEHGIQLKMEVPGIEEKEHRHPSGEQCSDRSWRAPVREGREGRELPSHRAPLRQLLAQLYPAQHGRQREGLRQLRQGHAEDRPCQARRSPAEADTKVEVGKELSAAAK